MKRSFKTLLSLLLVLLFLASAVLPSFALAPPISVSSTYESGKYYEQLLKVQLTGDMRKDIMAVARSQIGYLEGSYAGQVSGEVEGSKNYTEYNNYMYGGRSGGWCGMFVSWCAAMAGIPSSILKPATSAKPQYYDGYGFNFISDKEGVSPVKGSDFKGFYDLPVMGGSYVPQAGDLIFFGHYNSKNVFSLPRSCYKHVGLVDYCTVTYDAGGSVTYMEIHTIEGNVSNKVREKTYKMYPTSSGYVYEDTFISAFGIPAYKTEEKPSSYSYYDIGEYGGSTLKAGVSSDAVIKLQLALRVLEESYPSIDAPSVTGYFGTATKAAVMQYQSLKKLTIDGKCGPQSWASIRSALILETSKISKDFILDDDGTLLLYKGSAKTETLPENCTKIAPYAFYDNSTLAELTVSPNLETVEKNAFAQVSALLKVHFDGKPADFSSMDVEHTGNDAFLEAEHCYKTNTYTITFDVNGKKTTVECAENTVPVFTGSTDISDDTTRYFFTGWDSPLVPATKDTTYTATYYSFSAQPVLLTGSCSGDTFSKSRMSFDIYLKNTPGVSSFAFSADYSMYLSDLSFSSFSPALAGVCCDASLEGILQFRYEAEGNTASGDIRIGTVYFDVSENISFAEESDLYSIQLFFLVTDGYMRHQLPSGTATELSVSCDLVEVTIYNRMIYDYTEDGSLTISDVTSLLDILKASTSDEAVYSLKEKALTIGDVTNLLDLLSYRKSA